MNIQFHMKHIKLSDDQKAFISEKIQSLSKYDKRIDDDSTLVHIHVEHLHHKNNKEIVEMDIHIHVPHGDFYAKDTGTKPEETIDKCMVKFRHQIEKYKAKHIHTHEQTKLSGNQLESEFDDLMVD